MSRGLVTNLIIHIYPRHVVKSKLNRALNTIPRHGRKKGDPLIR